MKPGAYGSVRGVNRSAHAVLIHPGVDGAEVDDSIFDSVGVDSDPRAHVGEPLSDTLAIVSNGPRRVLDDVVHLGAADPV